MSGVLRADHQTDDYADSDWPHGYQKQRSFIHGASPNLSLGHRFSPNSAYTHSGVS